MPWPQPNSSGWDLGQDVSCGMVGMAGVVSWAIPLMRFVHVFVLLLICTMCVWLRPLWVCGQWQCCYGNCLSIILYCYSWVKPVTLSWKPGRKYTYEIWKGYFSKVSLDMSSRTALSRKWRLILPYSRQWTLWTRALTILPILVECRVFPTAR